MHRSKANGRHGAPTTPQAFSVTLTLDESLVESLAEAICRRLKLSASQPATANEATMAAAGTEHDLLTISDILARFQIARSTFHLWRRDRGFPKPKQTGERSPRWFRSEVDAWLSGQSQNHTP